MIFSPLDTLMADHRTGHAVSYADLVRVRQELEAVNTTPVHTARELADLAEDLELTGMPEDTCTRAAAVIRLLAKGDQP